MMPVEDWAESTGIPGPASCRPCAAARHRRPPSPPRPSASDALRRFPRSSWRSSPDVCGIAASSVRIAGSIRSFDRFQIFQLAPSGLPLASRSVPCQKLSRCSEQPVLQRLVGPVEVEHQPDRLAHPACPATCGSRRLKTKPVAAGQVAVGQAFPCLTQPLSSAGKVVARGPAQRRILLPEGVDSPALNPSKAASVSAKYSTRMRVEIVAADVDRQILAPVVRVALVDDALVDLVAVQHVGPRARRDLHAAARPAARRSFRTRPSRRPARRRPGDQVLARHASGRR